MNNLTISNSKYKDWTVLNCEGEINFNNNQEFIAYVESVLLSDQKKIALDFSEILLIASVGLGSIAKLHERITLHGGKMVILASSDVVQSVFETTGLNQLVEMVEETKDLK